MPTTSLSISGVQINVRVDVNGDSARVSIAAQWGEVSSNASLTLGGGETASSAPPRELDMIKKYFQSFDVNHDHRISKAEVKKAFPEWSERDTRDLFARFDRDRDGYINYVEFADWIMASATTAYPQLKQPPHASQSLHAKSLKASESVARQSISRKTVTDMFIDDFATPIQVEDSDPRKTERVGVTLKAGDYLQARANALLRDVPRTTAAAAYSTLKATREKFNELGSGIMQFARRKAVRGAGVRPCAVAVDRTAKNDAEIHLIAEALKNNHNLQSAVKLDDQYIKDMTAVAWKGTCKSGTALITQGDLQADYFYIVQEGAFDILVAEEEGLAQSVEKALRSVGEVETGESFGELALLYFAPHEATVVAKVDSVVWVIDRQNFKDILMKSANAEISDYCTLLNKAEILTPLLPDEKKKLAAALVEMHFAKGEVILQQGEPGNMLYIVYEGELVVVKDNGEQENFSASRSRKEVCLFGERALLAKTPCAATVTVCSETAKALALGHDSFKMLLGPLEDILKRKNDAEGQLNNTEIDERAGEVPECDPDDKPHEKILRKDLWKLGLLGCGGFGVVELWPHKSTDDTYAVKGLSKGYIVKTRMQESVINEKKIMMMAKSPFIIRLWETYNSPQTLYFLMEVALGGELYATYNKKQFWGSLKHAKFYTAGAVLAFVHLHQRQIIYRDLKPENLLINDKGQVKLTDMGLAKFVIGKTYTTCGTPDYFAPEMIASMGHTNAVDWWTLGILIFELISGHPPFESAYPMQIYSKVMKGITKVTFPRSCQGPVGDLIKALLRPVPSERLCCRIGGVHNLQNHSWYHGFDWGQFESLEMEPPYKPVVKSKKDIGNFFARKEDIPRQIEYLDDGSGWDKDFATSE